MSGRSHYLARTVRVALDIARRRTTAWRDADAALAELERIAAGAEDRGRPVNEPARQPARGSDTPTGTPPKDLLRDLAGQAQGILDVLASGSEPYASTGYGYEHMGDYTRDVRPLCEGVIALAARVEGG